MKDFTRVYKFIAFAIFSILIILSGTTKGQVITNYDFTAGYTEEYVEMTGSTTLIGPNKFNTSSSIIPIGFEVVFIGQVYNQFSVNANGVLRLGDEQVLTNANTYAIPGNARITPFAGGFSYKRIFLNGKYHWIATNGMLSTSPNGKVHYKVIGTAPNRVLVVEWLNMEVSNSSNTADATFQLLLSESGPESGRNSGRISFIYDNMKLGQNFMYQLYRIGFGRGAGDGNYMAVDAVNDTVYSDFEYSNFEESGNIDSLNRLSNIARKYFSFNAGNIRPKGRFNKFSTSCPASNAITINFEENSNDEAGIVVYRKRQNQTDDAFKYVGSVPPDSRSFSDGNIVVGQSYTYRFFLAGESALSTRFSEYSPPPASSGYPINLVRSGKWTSPKVWGGVMPGINDDVVIGCANSLVLEMDGAGECNNITIGKGSVLTVKSGNTLYIKGNLTNNGILNQEDGSEIIFIGSSKQAVTNNGLGETNDEVFQSTDADPSWGNNKDVVQKTITVPAGGYLNIKNVLVDITHGYLRDLEIVLKTPSGEKIDLSIGRGGQGDNYSQVIFSDMGRPLPATIQNVDLTGNYQPEELLTNYSGPFEGVWILEVKDNFKNYGGTLNDFQITLSTGGSNNFVFKNITIDNSSAAGVKLNSGIAMEGNLSLTKGIVHSDNTNFITIKNTATSDPGSKDSFINGPIRKIGDTDFIFPVGDGRVYAPIQIIGLQNADTTTEFTATYFNQPSPNGGSIGNGFSHVSAIEYWDLDRTYDAGNDAACYVKLSWIDDIRSEIVDGNDLIVSHYNSTLGEWENMGGANFSANGLAGSIETATLVSSFSPFSFGSLNGFNPLPVELLSFTGERQNKGNLLNWKTTSETDNDFFLVEKSQNGDQWTSLNKVDGKGNSNSLMAYSYLDAQPFYGQTYYRLKQVDYDGDFEYSDIISVTSDEPGKFELDAVYPNPTKGKLTVNYISPDQGKVTVHVVDMQGLNQMNETYSMGQGNQAIELDLDMLDPGIYVMTLQNNDRRIVRKIIKE